MKCSGIQSRSVFALILTFLHTNVWNISTKKKRKKREEMSYITEEFMRMPYKRVFVKIQRLFN